MSSPLEFALHAAARSHHRCVVGGLEVGDEMVVVKVSKLIPT